MLPPSAPDAVFRVTGPACLTGFWSFVRPILVSVSRLLPFRREFLFCEIVFWRFIYIYINILLIVIGSHSQFVSQSLSLRDLDFEAVLNALRLWGLLYMDLNPFCIM